MQRRGPFTMYYDAGCPFCIRMVRLFRATLGLRGSKFFSAQSDPTIHEEMREARSWIVVCADGEHQYGWRGLATVLSDTWMWPLGKVMALQILQRPGESLYHWIERHRPLLSKVTNFLNADPPAN